MIAQPRRTGSIEPGKLHNKESGASGTKGGNISVSDVGGAVLPRITGQNTTAPFSFSALSLIQGAIVRFASGKICGRSFAASAISAA